jgi:hypothetical protein
MPNDKRWILNDVFSCKYNIDYKKSIHIKKEEVRCGDCGCVRNDTEDHDKFVYGDRLCRDCFYSY